MPSDAYRRLVGAIPQQPHMEQVVTKFQKNFVESEARRAVVEDAMRQVRLPLAGQVRAEGEKAVATIGRLAKNLAGQKLPVPAAPMKVRERLTAGSISITRVPPYDWPWTWNATNGDAQALVQTNQFDGYMSCGEGNGGNGGAGAGAAALGVYFQPPFPGVAILNISASPAFNYIWGTYDAFASSHSDAWIGLYVGAYDLSGNFLGAPIDQQIFLWNESHDFLASPNGSGSNSGYYLSAGTFVNGEEFYEIWVWCGGSASGDGDHTFWGSYGDSFLNVTVPWIQLDYFGGGG